MEPIEFSCEVTSGGLKLAGFSCAMPVEQALAMFGATVGAFSRLVTGEAEPEADEEGQQPELDEIASIFEQIFGRPFTQ